MAIFEEDRPKSSDAIVQSPDSAVLVVEQRRELNDHDDDLPTDKDNGSFRFATSVFDEALKASMQTIREAVEGVKRIGSQIIPNMQNDEEEEDKGEEEMEEIKTQATLPDSILENRNVSVEYSNDGRRGWKITPARRSSNDVSENEKKEKILIRCHLFKGRAVKEWFDLGHLSNPVTRTTVLMDDWCRLTDEEEAGAVKRVESSDSVSSDDQEIRADHEMPT